MEFWSIEFWALIVTALSALWGFRISLYIRRREFEDIYIQRYWEILNRIGPRLRVQLMMGEDHILDREKDGVSDEELKALWDYLLLCEDEIDLRAQGNVTDETWAVWSSSICDSVRRFPHRPMFLYIEKQFDEHPIATKPEERPFQQLRKVYANESSIEDPWAESGRWRNAFTSWLSGRRYALPWVKIKV